MFILNLLFQLRTIDFDQCQKYEASASADPCNLTSHFVERIHLSSPDSFDTAVQRKAVQDPGCPGRFGGGQDSYHGEKEKNEARRD